MACASNSLASSPRRSNPAASLPPGGASSPGSPGPPAHSVTVLAFFLPSLQDQWDRWQARQVIQRYVQLGRDFMQRGPLQARRGDLRQGLRAVREPAPRHRGGAPGGKVEQVNADPAWGAEESRGTRGERLPLPAPPAGRAWPRERAARGATLNSYGVFLTGERRSPRPRARSAIASGSTRPAPRPGSTWATCSPTAGARAKPRPPTGRDSGWTRAAWRPLQPRAAARADRTDGRGGVLVRAARWSSNPGDPEALRVLADELERNGKTAEAAILRARLAKLPPRPKPPSRSRRTKAAGSGSEAGGWRGRRRERRDPDGGAHAGARPRPGAQLPAGGPAGLAGDRGRACSSPGSTALSWTTWRACS